MKKIAVLDLRPTQFACGMREVASKAEKLVGFKPKDREAFLQANPVPVILAPRNRHYLIDHHHLARAAWEAGIPELYVEARGDFSTFTFEALWKQMEAAHWVYLTDQFGNGPRHPIELPETVRGLADDPYRSLSWRVRDKGGYTKNTQPFSEFRWAEFFRKNLKTHPVFDEFDAAVAEALALARSPEAAGLPGAIAPGTPPVPAPPSSMALPKITPGQIPGPSPS